jgi:hypothetical protein
MSIINKACCLDKLIQIMKRHIIGVRKLVRLLGFEFGAITTATISSLSRRILACASGTCLSPVESDFNRVLEVVPVLFIYFF